MRGVACRLLNFLSDEEGPTAVEYAVMLAFIIIVCITAISAMGTNVSFTFGNASTKISANPS
jgi:pilus assembly protein Flp/PilA